MNIIGVIPARYKSTRFEGKPLVLINGIPMLKRTYLQAKKSKLLTKIIVATEDERIVDFCLSEKIPVEMTSAECLTGTDRVAEISLKYKSDLYINIQCDEPVIDPKSIEQIANLYMSSKGQYHVYNLYKVIHDETEINSNTIIKVITNHLDETMYMSRLPVPYSNSGLPPNFKQQIPVYGFTRLALEFFSSHKKTLNEQFEDIELLRFVDLGYKIKMEETSVDSIAVDVPDDIEKVVKFLNINSSECN
jgi:3-deoxy-D-manno-octulosonate cytidylyltransferase